MAGRSARRHARYRRDPGISLERDGLLPGRLPDNRALRPGKDLSGNNRFNRRQPLSYGAPTGSGSQSGSEPRPVGFQPALTGCADSRGSKEPPKGVPRGNPRAGLHAPQLIQNAAPGKVSGNGRKRLPHMPCKVPRQQCGTDGPRGHNRGHPVCQPGDLSDSLTASQSKGAVDGRRIAIGFLGRRPQSAYGVRRFVRSSWAAVLWLPIARRDRKWRKSQSISRSIAA
jgi:hypothetical protein